MGPGKYEAGVGREYKTTIAISNELRGEIVYAGYFKLYKISHYRSK